jgi:sec-independent protein translocase protein TatB
MFGIDANELLIIAVVALVVIGPKDLPRVMRTIGNFVGHARGMARHFRTGLDAMIRETELEDMEKKWTSDNERIMREHPPSAEGESWGQPVPALDGDADADADIDTGPPRLEKKGPAKLKAPPARGRQLRSGAAPPIPARPAPPAADEGA